jgi:hypothetical protein
MRTVLAEIAALACATAVFVAAALDPPAETTRPTPVGAPR